VSDDEKENKDTKINAPNVESAINILASKSKKKTLEESKANKNIDIKVEDVASPTFGDKSKKKLNEVAIGKKKVEADT